MARPSLNEVEAEAVWEAVAAMGTAEAVGGEAAEAVAEPGGGVGWQASGALVL